MFPLGKRGCFSLGSLLCNSLNVNQCLLPRFKLKIHVSTVINDTQYDVERSEAAKSLTFPRDQS